MANAKPNHFRQSAGNQGSTGVMSEFKPSTTPAASAMTFFNAPPNGLRSDHHRHRPENSAL